LRRKCHKFKFEDGMEWNIRQKGAFSTHQVSFLFLLHVSTNNVAPRREAFLLSRLKNSLEGIVSLNSAGGRKEGHAS
jgi:hypothetical protein